MKGRTVFAIFGWCLLGLGLLSFILRAWWHVESGQDFGYRNYKNQPMTYLGFLATMAIGALIVVVGIYSWIKKAIQSRRDHRISERDRSGERNRR
jgi:hypothetical protein